MEKSPCSPFIEKTSYKPAETPGNIPVPVSAWGIVRILLSYGKIPTPITSEMLHSKCGWTPFEGHFALFPTTVIMGGKVVYQDGEFFKTKAHLVFRKRIDTVNSRV